MLTRLARLEKISRYQELFFSPLRISNCNKQVDQRSTIVQRWSIHEAAQVHARVGVSTQWVTGREESHQPQHERSQLVGLINTASVRDQDLQTTVAPVIDTVIPPLNCAHGWPISQRDSGCSLLGNCSHSM